jgi:CTP synthase
VWLLPGKESSQHLGKIVTSKRLSNNNPKFDPYLNVDPGTLNPYEHGECYVDGAETDLDLTMNVFLNVPTSQANNVTTGRIYLGDWKERRGRVWENSSSCSHTNEIKDRMQLLGILAIMI